MINYAAIRSTVAYARAKGWIWIEADRRAYDTLVAQLETLEAERDFYRDELLKTRAGIRTDKAVILLTIKDRLEKGIHTNATSLSREFGVSVKTVHRLVQRLREQFGMSVEFDRPRNSYSMKEQL
jgi:hypothetical protein